MEQIRSSLKKLEKYKYPLLVLLVGVVLLLWPGGHKGTESAETDLRLAELLSAVQGVGESRVALSEQGAVIVCDGAEDAKVRLEILQAIRSYTGLNADRITILKMAEHGRGRNTDP